MSFETLSPSQRALMQHLPIGVLQVQVDGVVSCANARACQLGGYSLEELRGTTCYQLLQLNPEHPLQSWPHLLQLQRPWGPVEAALLRREQGSVPVQISGTPSQPDDAQAHLWLFLEDPPHPGEEQGLQRREQEIVEAFAAQIGRDLEAHLDTIRRRAERVLSHEGQALSHQGTRELEMVIAQCRSLRRFPHQAIARETHRLNTRWNAVRLFGQLRLRVLRLRGSRPLRTFLSSEEGQTLFASAIQQAARQPDLTLGLELLYSWLLQQDPPLLPDFVQKDLWQSIQPVLLDALSELRSSLSHSLRKIQEGFDSQEFESPLPARSARPSTVSQQLKLLFQPKSPPPGLQPGPASGGSSAQMPAQLGEVFHHLLQHFEALGLSRWLPRHDFASLAYAQLSQQASQGPLNALDLEPLWSQLQHVPDLDPYLLNHYFYQVVRCPTAIALELPVLLSDASQYDEGDPFSRIRLPDVEWDQWDLLELPIPWRDAIPELLDRMLDSPLFSWCDPLLFERFLEQRMAWFLLDDTLDLEPLCAFFHAANVPQDEYLPFVQELLQPSFPWSTRLDPLPAQL